jgi:hypothetical protein
MARAAEIKMRIRLPGNAHSSMDLYVLLGGKSERLACRDSRGGSRAGQLFRLRLQRPCGMVGVGTRKLISDVYIGEAVLDGLKTANLPPKRIALQRVLAGRLQTPVRTAELFECQQYSGSMKYPVHEL